MYQKAAVGNFVWNDQNADGIYQYRGAGISGLNVTLYYENGSVAGTTSTNANGLYSFTNLNPGNYYLGFEIPTGFYVSPQWSTGDYTNKANQYGFTNVFALISGQTDDTQDAAMYQLGSIGDFVWTDSNANGIYDTGEVGQAGVTVRLFRENGTPITSTITDANGYYLFGNLLPNNYYVIVTKPTGWNFSPAFQGTDDEIDSDVDPTTGKTPIITLFSGQNQLKWDAGLYQNVTIGSLVWNDLNANGRYDTGETGISDVTVDLYNNTDTRLASTTTDSSGNYTFANLIPGTYYLKFTTPTGYYISPLAYDNKANPLTGQTATFTLTSGQSKLDMNAGMYQKATVGNFVWNDQNADGIYQYRGAGISGLNVTLYYENGSVAGTTQTNANGLYSFTNLNPGNYYLGFEIPTGFYVSPQWSTGDYRNKANQYGYTEVFTLISGQTDDTQDAAMYQLGSIGDFVWTDSNANGIYDTGETGQAGVTVKLYRENGTPAGTTTTDANGYYLFSDLVPNNYYVQVTKPTGYNFSPAFQGTDEEIDSDVDPTTGKTPIITLSSGQNQLKWDAGLYQNVTISSWVWNDLNQNGDKEEIEPYLSGVIVNLYNSSDVHLGSTTTDSNGIYTFNNLLPGTYYLTFSKQGFLISPVYGDLHDNKVNPATGKTPSFTLYSGESQLNMKAGMYGDPSLLATVGNFVWNDQNADGIYQFRGAGISGLDVTLYYENGSVAGTTQTNDDGFYYFTNLNPGNYYLGFEIPTGFYVSPQWSTGDYRNKANQYGYTNVFTLVEGQTDITQDAAMYQLGSIGDFVWTDSNANGIYDTGEVGQAGVTVRLFRENGTPAGTTTTDASGHYLFSDLIPNNYYVTVTKPSGYTFSPAFQGTDDEIDSDVDPTTGKTPIITLFSGQNQLKWDAGLYQNVTIGSLVWNDLNANGRYDTGETGISDVTVDLYNNTDTRLASTTTDSGGNYTFANLIPGTYYLKFTTPIGYYISPLAYDNKANPLTGETATFTLTSGQSQLDMNAGMYQKATVGNFVWNDQNADGIYQYRGAGISELNVTLYYENGSVAGTTTTDLGGLYSFSNLTPGNYYLQFEIKDGFYVSPQWSTGDYTNKANQYGFTDVFTLISGQTDYTQDAAMYQLGSIGDFVWTDSNANGIYDTGETGQAGVTVRLYKENGAPAGATTTDASGYYLFSDLIPNNYYVQVTKPSGWNFSPAFQGTDDEIDSDVDPTTGKTPIITLFSGQNQLKWDAGLYQNVTIGSLVWNDLNANGRYDTGETGISDVTVDLYDNTDTRLATTTTDSSGNYTFANLIPGTYYLKFTTPTGYYISPLAYDNKANPLTGETATFTLTSGQSQLTWNAGMYQNASIGNWVWNDQNADGIYNGRGWGLEGVRVELYTGTGTYITFTTTDANGNYTFDNLTPGTYMVKFILLDGFLFSPANQGSDPTRNSKANPATGYTDPITVVSAENNPYIDAAMYEPVSVGNLVWNDLNWDGILDAGEPGISDIRVELYNGLTNEYLDYTTTDGNGNYIFEDLKPDFYYVKFINPVGYTFSPQYAVEDPSLNSSADPFTGETASREYTSGTEYMYVNAGMVYGPAADIGVTTSLLPAACPGQTWPPLNGQIIMTMITVTNNGPDNATGVQITDSLPSTITYWDYSLSTNGGATWTISERLPVDTYNAVTGIWNIGNLNSGSSIILVIRGRVNATTGTIITNTATKTSENEYDWNPNNNSSTDSVTVG